MAIEFTKLVPTNTRTKTEADFNHERRMYGCTEEELCQQLQFLVKMNSYHDASPEKAMMMSAASIMSDAQEAIERDMKEMGRQYLNKAKWLLFYLHR